MKFLRGLAILFSVSGALLTAVACTGTAPTPALTTDGVKTLVAQAVQTALPEQQATLQAAATSTLPPAPTQPAPASPSSQIVATAVAGTLTAQPTSTPLPTATSTEIPMPPTATALPPTVPATPLPPALIALPRPTATMPGYPYPAPYLGRPAKWSVITGQNTDITFTWRSNVLLQGDNMFILYTRWTYDYDQPAWSGWCITAWTQDTQYTSTGDWRNTGPGCFKDGISGVQKVIQWKVVIQTLTNGQVVNTLSPESEYSEFIWKPVL